MPLNLNPVSATYNASGKFGASLNGGKASGASPLPTSGAFTVEVWAKGSGANTNVIVGQLNAFWIGHDVPRNVVLHYGSGGTEVTISSAVSLNDTNWHHIEWDYDPATGSKLYVDGALAGSSATTMAAAGATYAGSLEVRTFASGAFSYAGDVDELAFWSGVQHTGAFAPRAAAIANNSAGLLGLYHFDNDTTDSAGAADTVAPNLSSPTAASTGATTGSGAVTTDEGNGTLYCLASGNATETAATVKASGATQAITSAGSKAVTVSGLIASTTYYLHFLHRDAAGNDSTVANSASFTTSAAGDTTAPTLTSPTGTQTGQTTASGTVSTNEANGTLYRYASTNAVESAATVKAANLTSSVTATGAQTVGFGGLAAGTTYYAHYVHRDAAGNDSTVANSAGFTTASAPAANNALASNTAGVLFSPYNWNVGASSAKTINPGAYFETIFGGTGCVLNFDMTGIATPYPQISYRVDGYGPWITTPIAASVAITMPAETAGYANKPGHLLQVRVKSMTETQQRWSPQATAVALTGIILDAGKTLTATTAKPLRGLFFGDSITEGVRTVKLSDVSSTSTDQPDSNDSAQGWAFTAGLTLGAEFGIVGFGASGFIATGSGGIPPLPTSYSQMYSGVARSFTPQPDFIVLMEGTNDGSDVTGPATTVLNGLLAATTTAKIIVMRPFNGAAHAAQLQAAIATCSAPSRVTYVDTAGWFNNANSADGLHPNGVENITHIAPLATAAIKSALAGTPVPPTLTARTVTLTLATGLGANNQPIPAANLSGVKVSFFDEPTPDKHTVARYNTAAGATNASGVMTFPAQSTLAPGGSGSATVQTAAGDNLFATVAVA